MGTEAASGGSARNLQEIPTPEGGMYYTSNGYGAPQLYYDYNAGGYAESPGVSSEQWEEYMRFMGMDTNEVAPTPRTPQGYVYPSQPPFSPYGPGSPAMGPDGQLYGPQAGFQFFQQQGVSGPQFVPQVNPMQGGGVEGGQQHGGEAGVNGNRHSQNPPSGGISIRPRAVPVMIAPPMPYNRMVAVSAPMQDARFDGRMGQWAESPKGVNGQQGFDGSAPMRIMPSQENARRPVAPLQMLRGNGPGRGGRGRGMGPVFQDHRMGGRGWNGNGVYDKGRGRGRGAPVFLGNGTGLYDVATEQNRGPRTIRTRGQRVTAAPLPGDLAAAEFNKPEFPTTYETAKFFVIKSYSEDDVHKSIKYKVWASTPTGNKRLEAAYQEAQAQAELGKGRCPVFLLFSVNASGQFCGVAEMVGPVDHTNSVEYWQQDKWNGQFQVVWHMIKDVPNSLFRHIILANNENKPVTNSRDTQEVSFSQGLEILDIFKNYAAKTSILDDFSFYDDRQKTMQEKRARQMQQQQQHRQRQTFKETGGESVQVEALASGGQAQEGESGGNHEAASESTTSAVAHNSSVAPLSTSQEAVGDAAVENKEKVSEVVNECLPETNHSAASTAAAGSGGGAEAASAQEAKATAGTEVVDESDNFEGSFEKLAVSN